MLILQNKNIQKFRQSPLQDRSLTARSEFVIVHYNIKHNNSSIRASNTSSPLHITWGNSKKASSYLNDPIESDTF